VNDRREVWITGVGLLTCLGNGLDATWDSLVRGDLASHDDKTFAPYFVHPLGPINLDAQIPKKSDQRQMESWQRYGVYAAGLALVDAGIAGKPELLDRTDMVIAAGGGERDIAVDTAILAGMRRAADPGAFLNERLMSDLRPTLFLAQLPNMLAGNISLVHGVVGSSRTFLGSESAGTDAVRIAQARIASGQSDMTLVGGAYNGARWDVLLMFEQEGVLLRDKFRPVWDRGPQGGLAPASIGAFLVLESADHARSRQARARARIGTVQSSASRRQPGTLEATLNEQWGRIAAGIDRARAVIVSGAAGLEPATSAEHRSLAEIGLPVRNTATYIGHGVESQFIANIGIACAVLDHGKLFPPTGSGDAGECPQDLTQVAVTGVGPLRGEGLALVQRAG